MSWLSDVAQSIQGHTPGNLPSMPGSAQSAVDAIALNKWNRPFGKDANSFDTYAGGFSSENPLARSIGRAVGSYFAVSGISNLAGGEAGAETVGAETGSSETFGMTGNEGEVAGEGAGFDPGGEIPANGAAPAGNPAAQNIVSEPTAPASPDAGTDIGNPGGPGETPPPASEKGMVGKAWDWINARPVNTLIAGQMVSGAAGGAMQSRAARKAAEEKRRAEQEAREYPAKQKMGNPSVGGRGVNVNLRRGPDGILRRPDGTPVFRPGTGIINGQMNGTRG